MPVYVLMCASRRACASVDETDLSKLRSDLVSPSSLVSSRKRDERGSPKGNGRD